MEEKKQYMDPFLKGMIQKTDTEHAPDDFVFQVMRAVETAPAPKRQGFSSRQLLSVILLGAAASIIVVVMIVVPGFFNLTSNGGIHELTTILPAMTHLFYSLFGISESITIPNILGVGLAVLVMLAGVDLLFRGSRSARHKKRNTLFVI